MAVFYKGSGFGRFYSQQDARQAGFEARNLHRDPSGPDGVIRHIVDGTEGSPYISLTKSYSVALAYARMGRCLASEDRPGSVYEIDIPDKELPLIDPVLEIARSLTADVYGEPSYHHDGLQTTLMALVDPAHSHLLQCPIFRPPPGEAPRQSAHISKQLTAIVRALRDSEILALHHIPKRYLVNRFIGWGTKWRFRSPLSALRIFPCHPII